jgi:hypothetical protein
VFLIEAQSFTAKLVKPDAVGAWTYFTVPFQTDEVFGSRAQIPVKGTINGIPYRGSLLPHGDGRHYMVVNKTLQKNCGASSGEHVDVTMLMDDEIRTVTLPEDFEDALTKNTAINQIFKKFAYSHQKEYVNWITSAKKTETRLSRIDKAMQMISENKRLK